MREHPKSVDRMFEPSPDDGPSLRWLKTQARYVRARMRGHALVTAWLPNDRHLSVDYVFAVLDASVVLQGRLDDGSEVHFSVHPDDVILEMRPAPKDKKCAIFAFIGASRTPQPFLDCNSEEPHEPGEEDEPHD